MKSLISALAACAVLFCGAEAFAEAEAVPETAAAPAVSYTPGTYKAKAKGYGGYVTMTVTIADDGTIASVKASGDDETPYVGGYALDEVPGWIVKAQGTDVDAYAGATFTYTAIIEATNDCLAQAAPAEAAATYKPGTYKAKAKGYGGYVTMTVTIADDGTIASVKASGDDETPYVGGYALDEVPGWIVKAQGTDVDAYAGATFTYTAIIEAVNDCLAQAGN